MKKLCLVLSMLVAAISISTAQVKAVHFKKLQEFLPTKEVKEFKRQKPTGSSQTVMGFSTSEAGVRYEAIMKDTAQTEGVLSEQTKYIEVKISDMIAMPYATMAFQLQQDYENESEESSQKSVMIKGKYKGLEEIQQGEYKSAKVGFAIANRYVINLETNGFDDVKVLYSLIDSMNLEGLEKLTSDTK